MYAKLPRDIDEACEQLATVFDQIYEVHEREEQLQLSYELGGDDALGMLGHETDTQTDDFAVLHNAQTVLKTSLYHLVEALDAEFELLTGNANKGDQAASSDACEGTQRQEELMAAVDRLLHLLQSTSLRGDTDLKRRQVIWGMLAWSAQGLNTVDVVLQSMFCRIWPRQSVVPHVHAFPITERVVRSLSRLQHTIIIPSADPREMMLPLSTMLNRALLYLSHVTPTPNQPFVQSGILLDQYSDDHVIAADHIVEGNCSPSARVRPLLLPLATSLSAAVTVLSNALAIVMGNEMAAQEQSECRECNLVYQIAPIMPSPYLDGPLSKTPSSRSLRQAKNITQTLHLIMLRTAACVVPFLSLIDMQHSKQTMPFSMQADLQLLASVVSNLSAVSFTIFKARRALEGLANLLDPHTDACAYAAFAIECAAVTGAIDRNLLARVTQLECEPSVGTIRGLGELTPMDFAHMIRNGSIPLTRHPSENSLATSRPYTELSSYLQLLKSTAASDLETLVSTVEKSRTIWIGAIHSVDGHVPSSQSEETEELAQRAQAEESDPWAGRNWEEAAFETPEDERKEPTKKGISELADYMNDAFEQMIHSGESPRPTDPVSTTVGQEQPAASSAADMAWDSIAVADADDFAAADQLRCGWFLAQLGVELVVLASERVEMDAGRDKMAVDLLAGATLGVIQSGHLGLAQAALIGMTSIADHVFASPHCAGQTALSEGEMQEQDEWRIAARRESLGAAVWRTLQAAASFTVLLPNAVAPIVESFIRQRGVEESKLESLMERAVPAVAGSGMSAAMQACELLLNLYNIESKVLIMSTVIQRSPYSSVRTGFYRFAKDMLASVMKNDSEPLSSAEKQAIAFLVQSFTAKLQSLVEPPVPAMLEEQGKHIRDEDIAVVLDRLMELSKDCVSAANILLFLASHPHNVKMDASHKINVDWDETARVTEMAVQLTAILAAERCGSTPAHARTARLLNFSLTSLLGAIEKRQ